MALALLVSFTVYNSRAGVGAGEKGSADAPIPQDKPSSESPPPLGAPVSDDDRTFRDFGFKSPRQADDATSLRVRLASPLPRDKVRAVTIHLKSGEGWHSADIGPSTDSFCDGLPVRTPLSAFAPEGSPEPIGKADVIRVSAWKNANFDEPIELAEAMFDAPARLAIVRSTDRTAAGDVELAGSLADRCARLLDKTRLAYDFVPDDFAALLRKEEAKTSRAYDLALLPYSPRLSGDEHARLKAFVRAGGKLIVFFNADKTLGELLGVEPGPWRSTGTRAYTAIDASPFFGRSRRIPHFTEGVIAPRPMPNGKARKAATWIAAFNRPVGSPALAISPSGAWFAHIPPRAYPAAADLIYTIATNLVPSLAVASEGTGNGEEGTGSNCQTVKPSNRQTLSCLSGKTCAAWVNTAELPVDSFGRLRELGLDSLFMHWQTAHEHKRPFPESAAGGKRFDIEDLAADGRKAGLKIHAWATCFTLDGVSDEERAKLAQEKRLSASNPLWLDPTLPKNHDLVVARLAEMAKRGVDGVHIDYARTSDDMPQSPETTAAITEFVRKASKAVRAANPGIVFTAAVFPTPESAARRNQDWPTWVKEGLVDYVCPMVYTESPAEFRAQLAACLAVAPADRILPGIGTGADESQTDATATAAEITEAARNDCRGVAFFTLNDSLLEVLEAFQ